MKSLSLLFALFITVTFTGCVATENSPVETFNNAANLLRSGDIVVTNNGDDSIVLLDEDGHFKEYLVDSQTDTTLVFNGLTYDSVTKSILYINDSTVAINEAVKRLSLYDGSVTTIVTTNQLTGTLPGLARLSNGELVVAEQNTALEKFDASGGRIGAPFLNTITANIVDVNPLSNGGFITCSTGTTNTVRTYNAAGTAALSATSATPVGTPALGAVAASSCAEDKQGRFVVAYSGATDAIRIYNSAMTTTVCTYIDTNVLTNPGKIAVKPNGNILVVDSGFNHIVELNSSCGFVRLIGSALSTPFNIAVIP